MATIRQKRRGLWEVRVFVGRDERGRPVQASRTVHGGKKDAEKVAAQLALKPVRSVGRRTAWVGAVVATREWRARTLRIPLAGCFKYPIVVVGFEDASREPVTEARHHCRS